MRSNFIQAPSPGCSWMWNKIPQALPGLQFFFEFTLMKSSTKGELSFYLHLQIFEAGDGIVVFLWGLLNFALLKKRIAFLVDLRHNLKLLLVSHSPHVQLVRSRRKNLSKRRSGRSESTAGLTIILKNYQKSMTVWQSDTVSCQLTSSSSMVKTRGCGLAWRWSRSLCPKEWWEWIWAMPQQCLWPSRGSFPTLMFLNDWDTSGYRAVCWGTQDTKVNKQQKKGRTASQQMHSFFLSLPLCRR